MGQSIIGNYAVPILERKTVWGTDEETKTAYVDTLDIARMTINSLRRPDTDGRTLTIAGPKAWTTTEIIELCENLSGGSKAKVVKVPMWILKVTRGLLSCFQPARDAADRQAFTDLSSGDLELDSTMKKTYKLLEIDPSKMLTLELYLDEYYGKIIKKLKEVGAESRQTDFYV